MPDSLDVKLAQMVMVGFRGAEPDECREFLDSLVDCPVAGVWLTDNDSPMGWTRGNIRSPEQLKRLTAALREASPAPMFIAVDGEGGQIIRLKERYGFPAFPSPQTLGEQNDLKHTRSEAQRLAGLLKECGFNFNFAPVLDVNKNPANPIIGAKGRSFSADPADVAAHAAEFIRPHHEIGLLCAGKHFPGHGSSATDSHKGMVDVTATWAEDELLPYERLIEPGLLDGVLTAHVHLRNIDPDYPATLSKAIVTGLLRERLGFDGVIFTDDMNMGAIQAHYSFEQSTALCILAGADVVLHANVDGYDPNMSRKTVATLRRLVEAGTISEERIDQSYHRITRLKQAAGLR